MTLQTVPAARIRRGAAALMIFAACGSAAQAPPALEQVLHARAVDGLKIGAPVMRVTGQAGREPNEAGHVVGLGLRVDRVVVTVRFDVPIQVFRSTRFELARDEDSRRIILMRDPDPPGLPLNAGEEMPLEVPRDTLEDMLWVAR